MFKKHSLHNDIYAGGDSSPYSQVNDSGMQRLFLRINHRLLDLGVSPQNNRHCLEIGGGVNPHLYFSSMAGFQTYTVSDLYEIAPQGKKYLHGSVKQYFHNYSRDPDYATLGLRYTRVIASHVLEHVPAPEEALLKWASLLEGNGILSIAIPCQPGWLWRLGQRLTAPKQIKSYRLTGFQEYDLLNSREHINDTQRLLKIIRFYFRKARIIWFPLMVPIIDFNLLCIIHLSMQHFKSD